MYYMYFYSIMDLCPFGCNHMYINEDLWLGVFRSVSDSSEGRRKHGQQFFLAVTPATFDCGRLLSITHRWQHTRICKFIHIYNAEAVWQIALITVTYGYYKCMFNILIC